MIAVVTKLVRFDMNPLKYGKHLSLKITCSEHDPQVLKFMIDIDSDDFFQTYHRVDMKEISSVDLDYEVWARFGKISFIKLHKCS